MSIEYKFRAWPRDEGQPVDLRGCGCCHAEAPTHLFTGVLRRGGYNASPSGVDMFLCELCASSVADWDLCCAVSAAINVIRQDMGAFDSAETVETSESEG